jgi:hypothetical protein
VFRLEGKNLAIGANGLCREHGEHADKGPDVPHHIALPYLPYEIFQLLTLTSCSLDTLMHAWLSRPEYLAYTADFQGRFTTE